MFSLSLAGVRRLFPDIRMNTEQEVILNFEEMLHGNGSNPLGMAASKLSSRAEHTASLASPKSKLTRIPKLN